MKEIQLTQGKIAIVDDEDFEWLSKFKWSFQHGYAAKAVYINPKSKTTVRMHQLIMNPPLGMTVDHIDRNKLNNQRSNLRVCLPRQNFRNRGKQSNGLSSKHKGVSISKARLHYRAKLTFDRNAPPLTKLFPATPEGEIAAAKQYNEWAKQYFGEFACLNEV